MNYRREIDRNKCYGLVRVSSEKQSKNTSLSHQKESITKYCEYHNLELIDILEEIRTGTTSNRDSLNLLKELVLNQKCDSVVVMKLDRLMRNFSDGVVFIKFLMNNNVKIISTTEDVNTDTISGKFFVNMLLSLSELERNTIVDRLNTGKINNFKNQKRHSGRICFGYKKVDDELVVDEEESKIVKYIFIKYNQLNKLDITSSMKTRRLLKLLKRNNFKYKGRNFESYHIRQILQNEFYVGTLRHRDEKTTHQYQTIVSRRLYNNVR